MFFQILVAVKSISVNLLFCLRAFYGTLIGIQLTYLWIKDSIRLIISSVTDPIAQEYSRFSTLFTPDEIVWYKPVCINRFIFKLWPIPPYENESAGLWGKNEYVKLTALMRYLSEPNFRNQVCVSYVSYFDFYLLVILCLICCYILYIIYHLLLKMFSMDDPTGRVLISKYISWLIKKTSQPILDVSTMRKVFTTHIGVKPKLQQSHTHPTSASIRSASASTIEVICASVGLVPYFVQLSKSDVRNGREGNRTYYWGKDIGVETKEFNPDKHSVIAMVDVDMYLDMPTLLATRVHTYMISTFQPTSVSKDESEYSYTFDDDDNVIYTVSGGAVYKHKVWNYSGDVYTVHARIWHGLGVRTTTYNIDRRQISNDHQIICLTPMKTYISPLFKLDCLQGDQLLRYQIAFDGFLRMRIKTTTGSDVSTGHVGKYACAKVSSVDDDTISTISKTGKVDLSMAQVKSVIDGIQASEAAILVDFHRKKVNYSLDTVFPVQHSVATYQFEPKDYDPEALKSMHPFMSPLMDECFAADKTKANDKTTILGRIKEVKPPDDLEITDFDLRVMKEFVNLLVPDSIAGTGHPVDFDEVYERQKKPTQRAILDRGSQSVRLTVDDPVMSFQKAECYRGVKDPRNISTIPATTKLNYSRYIYAFSRDVLKHQKWYAFSKTPLEIAQRVSEVCSTADEISNTDLHRMDGKVSKVLRSLESMYAMRWVHDDHKSDLAELMASQKQQKGVTKFGVKYETGDSRLSGSPETSDFNTPDGAFMAFKALRRTKVNGDYMSAQEAWDMLGIYGGDDGITPNVNPAEYVKSCSSVGQQLTIDVTKRGELGVTFLSRQYSPNVWYGSSDSMCDVPRQLAKLHVTPKLAPTTTPLMKLCEKMSGFYLTDRNTPIIGEMASLIVRRYGITENKNNLANYFSAYSENNQFPNDNENDWMTHVVMSALPTFDFLLFRNWLSQVEIGDADVLLPPLCVPRRIKQIESKRPVVVDDDVISTSSKMTNNKNNARAICKHIASGDCKFGENCNHLLKKQRCFGSKCKFQHGKPQNTAEDNVLELVKVKSDDIGITFGSFENGS